MNRDRLGHYLLKLGPMSMESNNTWTKIIIGIAAVWFVWSLLDEARVLDECMGAFSLGFVVGGLLGLVAFKEAVSDWLAMHVSRMRLQMDRKP